MGSEGAMEKEIKVKKISHTCQSGIDLDSFRHIQPKKFSTWDATAGKCDMSCDALCTVGQLCYINLKVTYIEMFQNRQSPVVLKNEFDREDFPQQSLMH